MSTTTYASLEMDQPEIPDIGWTRRMQNAAYIWGATAWPQKLISILIVTVFTVFVVYLLATILYEIIR